MTDAERATIHAEVKQLREEAVRRRAALDSIPLAKQRAEIEAYEELLARANELDYTVRHNRPPEGSCAPRLRIASSNTYLQVNGRQCCTIALALKYGTTIIAEEKVRPGERFARGNAITKLLETARAKGWNLTTVPQKGRWSE